MDKGSKDKPGSANIPTHYSESRRKFVEATLLATTASAAGILGSTQALAQATPKKGGALKLAVPSAARRLDPAIHGANEEFIISAAIFDNLVRVDAKLNPQPGLATDWKVSDDGKSWTFNIRRGVKFHHGRELTSKDVEFTINRLRIRRPRQWAAACSALCRRSRRRRRIRSFSICPMRTPISR